MAPRLLAADALLLLELDELLLPEWWWPLPELLWPLELDAA
jgi:hypothetical protein